MLGFLTVGIVKMSLLLTMLERCSAVLSLFNLGVRPLSDSNDDMSTVFFQCTKL